MSFRNCKLVFLTIAIGFLYREQGKYFFARLPDGHSPRFEVRWRPGGLPMHGLCFLNEAPRCKPVTLTYERQDGRVLTNASTKAP